MKQYHLNIPSPMMEKLKELSKKEERTIRHMILKAIEILLNLKKKDLNN